MAIRGNGVVGEMIIFLLVAALIWHSGQFTSLGKGWHLKKYGGSGIYNDWTKPIFAHNNLSYGTIVEIRNPKNGRKVRAICYDKMASKTKATELKRKKKKSKEGRERKRRLRSKGSTPNKKTLFGD